MASEAHQLHMFFVPFTAQGHTIPMLDMAMLFAERGARVSIITTPLNSELHQKTIDRAKESGHGVQLLLIEIPYSDAGLPHGCEIVKSNGSSDDLVNVLKAISMLQNPFEELVQRHLPDCIVSDMFLPWTVEVSNELHIPRLVFNGISYFALCVSDCLYRYKPFEKVSSDGEAFVVPGLPHPIQLTHSELPAFLKNPGGFREFLVAMKDADQRSFGVVMNTFYDLETVYVEHFQRNIQRNSWHLGPVCLRNRQVLDMVDRGKTASIGGSECLSWLDGQEANSVIYICFGSLCGFGEEQLLEIALALEASNKPFIWVVKDKLGGPPQKWMVGGMEERLRKKGLFINGWAPQILILNHPSMGGFMTHCGWNSVLEGVAAGVPFVTWPIFAEQFYNEKLITQVLKIGDAVGASVWSRPGEEEKRPLIKSESIKKAIISVMDGQDLRNRVRQLGEMARRAMDGGSSYVDLTLLLDRLKNMRSERVKDKAVSL